MKLTIICFFIILPFTVNCQINSVEKSQFGVQTGFLGLWLQNERKITSNVALRLEAGLDASFFGGLFYTETGYVLAPVLTVEPRYYYNLGRRIRKGKKISNNSGNFLSIKSSYAPNLFTISNYDNVQKVQNISLIPTYGIRRHIGNHFNYEVGLGYGFRHFFDNIGGNRIRETEAAVNLLLRIGYSF
jgi:hypothetical protein